MVQQEVPSTADGARLARALAVEVLPHAATSVVETVELLTSELVTNAITHGAPPIQLDVRVEPHLVVVAVSDRSDQIPEVQEPSTSDSHGRGLRIVSALASSWGHLNEPEGKTVWCVLSY
jgi:two-component sensor histidine kinase